MIVCFGFYQSVVGEPTYYIKFKMVANMIREDTLPPDKNIIHSSSLKGDTFHVYILSKKLKNQICYHSSSKYRSCNVNSPFMFSHGIEQMN